MVIGGPGLHREIVAGGVREDLLYMVSMEGVTGLTAQRGSEISRQALTWINAKCGFPISLCVQHT
jgi:tryptophan synthase alpha subunit